MIDKKYFIIVLFVIHVSSYTSANQMTDSLINVITKYEVQTHFESDTNYINTLIDIAKELELANPDSSLLFSSKAYKLSTKYGYPELMLKSAFAMTTIYIKIMDIEKLLQIANEVFPIAEKADRKSLGKVYNMFGAVYYDKSISDKTYLHRAKEMYEKTLNIGKEYDDTDMIIKALNSQAAVYRLMNDYSSALEFLYQAIGLAEKTGKEEINFMSLIRFNLAGLYRTLNDYDKALIEILKGVEIAEKNNDIINLYKCLYIAGAICQEQNKLDEALDYINRSLEISQKFNSIRSDLELKEVLVQIYFKKG